MKKFSVLTALFFAICTGSAAHLGFIMPSGAQRGANCEFIIGGQRFSGINDVIVSGGGVSVEHIEVVRGLPHPETTQRRYINSWLKGIHRGDPRAPEKPQSTEGWRYHPYYDNLPYLSDAQREMVYRFLFVRRNALQDSPAIRQRVFVRLKIAPDAVPGERELRLTGSGKVSNPLKFFISEAPDCREPHFPLPPAKPHVPHFALPSVLHGQVMPGERDRFSFNAGKGEKITFSAKGRALMPFIGDGVPGHFQMVLEVFDAAGRTVAYADDNHFDPDPVLSFIAPADGKYTLEVRDALFRGRDDFVYRIEARRGGVQKPKFPAPPLTGVKLLDGKSLQNLQVVDFPVLIKDRLSDKHGKSYRISAKKESELVVEVFSRRLGLPPDMVVKVFDQNGKMVAVNDDTERLKAGEILHCTADPYVKFTVPESGVYTISVADVAGAHGKDHDYYLRIDRPRPRFTVYAVPSALHIGQNATGLVTLAVERHDGHRGEIRVSLPENSPFGFIGSNVIPAGCDRTTLTLTTGKRQRREPAVVTMRAEDENFSTQVIPGDEMMQAFAYTHIDPARQLIAVRKATGMDLSMFKWHPDTPDVVALDKPVTLTVLALPHRSMNGSSLELVAANLPPWVKVVPGTAGKIDDVRVQGKGKKRKSYPMSITISADAAGKGKSANVLFKVVRKFTYTGRDGKKRVLSSELILPAVRVYAGGAN